uniref:Kazal-like domain-containing protein n=1 Tax=Gopherus agassizii TaxID=38772 RepID=A0A452J6A1_9SAUR
MYFIFLCCTLLQPNSLIGYYTYRPKYMEQQYGQSASKSNFIIITTSPPAAVGIFTRGFIMKICKLGIVAAAKLLLMILFTFCIFTLLCFVLHHGNYSFSVCSSGCKCATNQWDPVCGDKGITYMSACLAECKALTGQRQNMVRAFPSILQRNVSL